MIEIPPNCVLAFFKVTCPTCKFAMPFLNRSSLRVIGVSQDDEAATAKFAEQFGMDVEVMFDRAEDGYPLSNRFGVEYVPTLFVIDEAGQVSRKIECFDKEGFEDLGVEFVEDVPVYKPG
jgi:peroxiredoxin